jgi:hypothetical protein
MAGPPPSFDSFPPSFNSFPSLPAAGPEERERKRRRLSPPSDDDQRQLKKEAKRAAKRDERRQKEMQREEHMRVRVEEVKPVKVCLARLQLRPARDGQRRGKSPSIRLLASSPASFPAI